MHICIVDDDAAIRSMLRMTFEEEGYQVVEATNGQTALQCLQEHHDPSVVLLDYMMPVLDGGQLLRIVAEGQPLPANHAFILMTAADRILPQSVQSLLQQLQVPTETKPFNLNHLIETVATLCAILEVS